MLLEGREKIPVIFIYLFLTLFFRHFMTMIVQIQRDDTKASAGLEAGTVWFIGLNVIFFKLTTLVLYSF